MNTHLFEAVRNYYFWGIAVYLVALQAAAAVLSLAFAARVKSKLGREAELLMFLVTASAILVGVFFLAYAPSRGASDLISALENPGATLTNVQRTENGKISNVLAIQTPPEKAVLLGKAVEVANLPSQFLLSPRLLKILEENHATIAGIPITQAIANVASNPRQPPLSREKLPTKPQISRE